MTEENQSEEYCNGETLAFNRSAGILLYRRRADGKIEIAMQLRDDYPCWGFLGGGGVNAGETMWQGALRELKEETNYPIDEHVERVETLFGTRGFYAESGERVEDTDWWAIDVGDFPLKKKTEGAGYEFFALDDDSLPVNMMSYTRQIMGYIRDCIGADGKFTGKPETQQVDSNRMPVIYKGEYHPYNILPRDTYSGLSVFNENAKVLARRRNIAAQRAGKDFAAEDAKYGILRWDPQDPAFIVNTLLTIAEGQNPDKTLLEILRERQQAPKPEQQ